MIPQVRFGQNDLRVSRLALGGYPFGAASKAEGWDPFSEEGRLAAVRTIQAALDIGVRYIDTAPGFGNGQSESIIGEALRGRRGEVIVATRVGGRCSAVEARGSIEASLRRLGTDVIDVIQIDGGVYRTEDVCRILRDGLLDMLELLREEGKIRLIGCVVEEAWTAKPLIASFRFDMMQIRYNLIEQCAARHVLNEAKEVGLGVVGMRPTTGGVFNQICRHLAPRFAEVHDPDEVAVKFVLCDSRVHTTVMDLRTPEEVARYGALASVFEPPFDVASLSAL